MAKQKVKKTSSKNKKNSKAKDSDIKTAREKMIGVFDRNVNGWVTTPKNMKLPKDQQDRDMIARELLIKFQMSPKHPLVQLKKAYKKFD